MYTYVKHNDTCIWLATHYTFADIPIYISVDHSAYDQECVSVHFNESSMKQSALSCSDAVVSVSLGKMAINSNVFLAAMFLGIEQRCVGNYHVY